ncbi:MAG: hypothetical protein ACYS15_17095 [Planctomycetota bacterium]
MAGVLDALSRRVGRRPLRWFLGLWALLTAIWLLSGAIHFRSDRYADIPPVPEAVPYAAFLPGGARYRESFKFELDPQRLLFHDESRALPDHHFFVWPDEDGEFTRLVCWFLTLEGAYGWPRQWVRWSRGVAYDVSDPGRPVERAIPSSSPRESVNWELHQLSWSVMTGDGSTWSYGAWQWTRMLVWWLSIEAVAAMIVIGLWFWDGARYRRRLRHGWCATCGYDLQARGGGGACPECGGEQPRALQHPAFGAGRVFLAGWALLIVAWIAVAVLALSEREFPDLQGRLDELAREATKATPRPDGRPYSAGLMVAQWDYGWPLSFATLWESQRWVFHPGERPTAVVNPYASPGVSAFQDRIQWSRGTDDPTVYRHLDLCWSPALVQIAGLQFIALGCAGLLVAFRRLWLRGRVPRA